MARSVVVEVEMPGDLRQFRFPKALDRRLQDFMDKKDRDKQDRGEPLTVAERKEAEGLVDLAEVLSLLRLRAERAAGGRATIELLRLNRPRILGIRQEEESRGRHPPPGS